MGKEIITVNKLTKKFNGITALNKVSLKINSGEIFGLLGPNGAGKTTLISILATLMRPTSGSAKLNGYDVQLNSHDVRASIGLVFQETVLDLDLTAYDNLDFHARLYGMDKKIRQARIKELVKVVGLEQHLYRKVKDFSGGMKRRLEIAKGILHFPKILFLDEPTLGLDPQTRRNVLQYIKHLQEHEKITVLLTTHYIEEADFLCDRIAIIDLGKIKIIDKPSKLKQKLKTRKPTLEDVFLKYTGKGIRDEV